MGHESENNCSAHAVQDWIEGALKRGRSPSTGFSLRLSEALRSCLGSGVGCWSYSKSGSCFLTVVVPIFGFLKKLVILVGHKC